MLDYTEFAELPSLRVPYVLEPEQEQNKIS